MLPRSKSDRVMMERKKIAFFGLGVMGLPMAKRLLEAGCEVAGYDPDATRAVQLSALGGRGFSNEPFAIAPDVEAVITMLPSAKLVREAFVDKVIPVAEK